MRLQLVAESGHHGYGANRIVNLVHEVYLFLSRYHPEYLWDQYGPPPGLVHRCRDEVNPGDRSPTWRRGPASRHTGGMTRRGALRQAALGTRGFDLTSTAGHE